MDDSDMLCGGLGEGWGEGQGIRDRERRVFCVKHGKLLLKTDVGVVECFCCVQCLLLCWNVRGMWFDV